MAVVFGKPADVVTEAGLVGMYPFQRFSNDNLQDIPKRNRVRESELFRNDCNSGERNERQEQTMMEVYLAKERISICEFPNRTN